MTVNAAGTNGLTCLPKYGGARDNTFLVTHPMTDQRCLTSVIARRCALTAEPLQVYMSLLNAETDAQKQSQVFNLVMHVDSYEGPNTMQIAFKSSRR
jgi:hypothetical protein